MLQRRFIPRGTDHHTHVSLYAALAGCPSVAGLEPATAVALMRSLPDDRLNLVLGWHSARTPLTSSDLEELPPVLLVNLSLHGFRLTPAARAWLEASEPELVARHTDPSWCERNLPRLLSLFGRLARLDAARLEGFLAGLEAQGIRAAEDMALTGEEAWHLMRGSGWGDRLRFWATPETFESLSAPAQAQAEGLKLFTDGALGTRTAALVEPFLDGAEGMLLQEDGAFQALLADLHGHGKPLAIHAIGGRAIEQVIRALEVLGREGLQFPSVRLEHAQFITLDQARRARDLGLALSMQPNFSSDSVDYADRLPLGLRESNNPFRMLIDEVGFRPGRDLCFGSDGMPHGLEYALQWSLFPGFPGQRLNLEEALAGYGIDPEAPGDFPVVVCEAERRVWCSQPDSNRHALSDSGF